MNKLKYMFDCIIGSLGKHLFHLLMFILLVVYQLVMLVAGACLAIYVMGKLLQILWLEITPSRA